MPDTWTSLPTRTTASPNASADINSLAADVRLLKGGTAGTAPTTDIEALKSLDAAKVPISAIVNDLTTGGTAVPLSAEQGKILQTNKLSQSQGISFFISGAQTASTTVPKVYFRLPKSITLNATVPVKISLVTANTGATFIVDVHYVAYTDTTTQPEPTTIFTTGAGTNRPAIADGAYSADSGAADVTALAAGGYVAIYVDQIGSTVAGSDLMVTLITA